ncbi:MAG: exonuclease domain-containing protein [Clostridia bacterium]|nr:exonuclease domain-containing protein [Clostridia bacterium]
MIKNYISVDIENPNTRGNSICSIGIVIVKNNKIVDKQYSLINPENKFDLNNSKITGLCSADVKDAPTFKEYWNEKKELFKNNIIVGHNVKYDLNVIAKSLKRYDIELFNLNYYCTYMLSKRFFDIDSYSLDNVSNYLSINLNNHHNALEDAIASQKIFEKIKNNYDIGKYEIFEYESKLYENLDSKLETNVNSLFGIIQGISYDGVIDEKEISKLKIWIEENRLYSQYILISKIIRELELILEDNLVTKYERIKLISLVSSINKSKRYSEASLALQILNGILDGIICNQKINQKEIDNLKIWIEENDYLEDVYPYDKVVLEVNKVLDDGILTEEEGKYLIEIFDDIINPKSNDDEKIDFNGKTFCLTGKFETESKQQFSKRLQELGGIEKTGVSSKLDYLIVGSVGSEAWKFGKVGGKQAKAMELIEKGVNIKIIEEKSL